MCLDKHDQWDYDIVQLMMIFFRLGIMEIAWQNSEKQIAWR